MIQITGMTAKCQAKTGNSWDLCGKLVIITVIAVKNSINKQFRTKIKPQQLKLPDKRQL
jgi:hypothetical protein